MSSQSINPDKILRFSVWCVAVSCVAAALFLIFHQSGSVRGPSAGIGIMAAFIGSGVAAYFALRARDGRLIAAALASALPLAFWSWVLYDLVHVNAA